MKKKLVLGAIVFSVLLSGCGSGYTSSMETDSSYMVDTNGMYESPEYLTGFADEEALDKSTDYIESTDRKMIKTISLDTQTENYDEFMTNINHKINSVGGYVQELSQSGQEGYRYTTMVIRIPKEQTDVFLAVIEGESNITYRNEVMEDVTLAYVDIDSHKRMLLEEEDRLLELMKQAEAVDDIIAIESQLTNVRYQIDSMESQLRTYDNKIDYVTVNLSVDEVVRYTPVAKKGIIERIKIEFGDNLYDLADTIEDVVVYFVVHIPNILILAVIIALVVLIIKKLRKVKK